MGELRFFDREKVTPLAERLRPRSIEEVEGQSHILGEGGWLKTLILKGEIPSMILWGPPGSGKTTLARLISTYIKADFVEFLGTVNTTSDIKQLAQKANHSLNLKGRRTILFIDEIHRLNKAQQAVLLRYVEDGTFILIGATTTNPGFYIISPLLSRCKLVILERLNNEALERILKRALNDSERGLGKYNIVIEEEAKQLLINYSDGDARKLLSLLETAFLYLKKESQREYKITVEILRRVLGEKITAYQDRADTHYELISAFIKSLRGSDPDASLYWLARMIEAGEDPLFILRRLLIFASEDIGNADPMAIQVVASATLAFEHVGMPEGILNIVQAVLYCASAPKSNSVLKAWKRAKEDIKEKGDLPVPIHLKNAPIEFLKSLGYGKQYLYPHDYGGFVKQNYFPENFKLETPYYEPTLNGYERKIKERLEKLWKDRYKILRNNER